MKQTFDTDTILFKLFKASPLSNMITGGIYISERPDDSEEEDIVVNSITITQEYFPQLGASNVNIHVPDLELKIKGKTQKKANRERLEILAKEAVAILKNATLEGLSLIVEGQTTIKEPNLSQHYINFRIKWIIHN